MLIDSLWKSIAYRDLFMAVFPFFLEGKMKKVRECQMKTIYKLRSRKKLSVAFFIQTPTTWEYDKLYWLMVGSSRFDPIVIVVPYNYSIWNKGNDMMNVMMETCDFCKSRNYNYRCSLQAGGKWLDVKNEINPDVVFFTFPRRNCTSRYFIYNFEEKLTMYCQYATPIISDNHPLYNMRFHNLLWKNMAFTEYHHEQNIKYSRCRGDNSVVIGLLPAEKLIDANYFPKDVWKPQSRLKKKIIWAPHHTIGEEGQFVFATFLEYSDSFLEIADKYKDQIQIAFKPHPALFLKLTKIWGSERTKAYYEKWKTLENGQLEENDYIDLFLTSDAMIHDCGGFRVQYLCTKKPVMYLMHSDEIFSDSNDFGRQCLDLHYHGYSHDDIERFIQDIVIDGNDPLQANRKLFFEKNIRFKDDIIPSEKIINIIETAVWG